MIKVILTVLVLVLAAGAEPVAPQQATSPWLFPKPDAQPVRIDDAEFYDLGDGFFGALRKLKDQQGVVVILPKEFEQFLENQNRAAGKPPALINARVVAAAVLKAAGEPSGSKDFYAGETKISGTTVYVFNTKSGTRVGGFRMPTPRLVSIITLPEDQP